MGLHLQQSLKQQQQLVLTQSMQQAIKLLQLSQQELVAEVERELAENPALEEAPAHEPGEEGMSEALRSAAESLARDVSEQQNAGPDGDGRGEVDWEKVIEQLDQAPSERGAGASGPDMDDLPTIDQTLTAPPSLAEELLSQLGLQHCTDAERRAAVVIIQNIDERGYLVGLDLPDVAREAEAELDDAEGAHDLVLHMDPPGCGARSLEECLAVQARLAFPEDPFIDELIRVHLRELESRNYAAISRAMDMDVEDVVEYHKMLRTLDPLPGRKFALPPNPYITPDIEVVKKGGVWQILQNEDGLPRLRISTFHKQILQDGTARREDKAYIKERLESADFLIRSIFKRQRTIHKVMNAIIERQQDFFEHGPEALLPMVLREVADDAALSESTVSRVTTNKYVKTPHGIFELKYFFNAAIQRTSGEDLAAQAVKQRMRKIIADEDPKKPLSDGDIAKLLSTEGIQIARRTVAKYREALGILQSTQRKNLF